MTVSRAVRKLEHDRKKMIVEVIVKQAPAE